MIKLNLQFFGTGKSAKDAPRGGGGNSDAPSGIDKLPPQGASKTMSEAVTHTNPNYDDGREWRVNCNKCVLAYAMQRRGYDVIAGANQGILDRYGVAFNNEGKPLLDHPNYLTAWKDPVITGVSGTGATAYNDIEKQMKAYGDGAMAIIRVRWDGGKGGHVFMVENHRGKIVFNDGQPSNSYGVGASKSEIVNLLNQTNNRGNALTKLIRIDKSEINDEVMRGALLGRVKPAVKKTRRTK